MVSSLAKLKKVMNRWILVIFMVAYFCHHLSDNYVGLSDLYVVLSDLYVDLSDLYVDLSLIHLFENKS